MTGRNNIYTAIVADYSDSQLTNIISNAREYSRAQVTACEEEVSKRNIAPINQSFIDEGKIRSYVFKIKNDLLNKVSIADCKIYLSQEGLNNDQVNDIIQIATRKPQAEMVSPYRDKDHYGVPLGIGLLALSILFKIVRMLIE